MALKLTAPHLVISAELLLRNPEEITALIQNFVDSDKVQEYLRDESRLRLADPVLAATEADRSRWQAYAR